jgi:hypothetical protein
MHHEDLERHLRDLITLEETASPVLSVFADLHGPDTRRDLRRRAAAAQRVAHPGQRDTFDEAWSAVEEALDRKLADSTRSVAVFSRGGERPYFLLMQFEAELPTHLFVESTPVIFHLVELKDNYHRYALMICREDAAWVLEVNLGSVTRELWTRKPELRQRVGREWTRLHYLNHRRDRRDRFIKEKIAVLEEIVRSGGHSHIMLAGSPQLTVRVRKALPPHLKKILVDVVPSAARDRVEDVVAATLSTFLDQEERESQALVDVLRQELLRGGLAVAGIADSRVALEHGQADILLLTSSYSTEELQTREELIRLAQASGVGVEVVQHSDFLQELDGVGCLLRYRATPFTDTQAA